MALLHGVASLIPDRRMIRRGARGVVPRRSVRDALIQNGVAFVYHCTPLQYVPQILASMALYSKNQLLAQGFADSHLRPSSKRQDIARGFGDFIHMMTH